MLPYNPAVHAQRFGLIPFRSPLLGESFLFLRVLRCFSSPGSLPETMCSSQGTRACPRVGFPIRTSSAQTVAHTSPRLFAVYHVLLRQLAPRHPPCALSSLSLHVIRRRRYSLVFPFYAFGFALHIYALVNEREFSVVSAQSSVRTPHRTATHSSGTRPASAGKSPCPHSPREFSVVSCCWLLRLTVY